MIRPFADRLREIEENISLVSSNLDEVKNADGNGRPFFKAKAQEPIAGISEICTEALSRFNEDACEMLCTFGRAYNLRAIKLFEEIIDKLQDKKDILLYTELPEALQGVKQILDNVALTESQGTLSAFEHLCKEITQHIKEKAAKDQSLKGQLADFSKTCEESKKADSLKIKNVLSQFAAQKVKKHDAANTASGLMDNNERLNHDLNKDKLFNLESTILKRWIVVTPQNLSSRASSESMTNGGICRRKSNPWSRHGTASCWPKNRSAV